MKYLLDTHIFLWWLADDRRLSKTMYAILENPQHEIYVSVISAWEISIKQKLGKLHLRATLEECFEVNEFPVLSLTLPQILIEKSLPPYHKDPFDRMLIAQAKEKSLQLLTEDEKIKQYFPDLE